MVCRMVGRESAPLIPVGCGLCPCSSGFLSGRSCGFRSAWRPRLSSRPWLLRVSTGVVFASVRPTHVSAAAERVRRWLCSQGQPIRRGVERDLWSDLKLIQTGGFWLRLYGEIGRTSRRDRSELASRSVVLQCGVVLGAGGRVSRAGQPRAGSVNVRACRGWSMLHTRVHSASVETAESCGIAMSVAVVVLLPCARPPSPHMGARPPPATLIGKARHSNKKQPPSRRGFSLPCATPTTAMPTRRAAPLHSQPTTHCPRCPYTPQSRAGTRPISVRSATDLEVEVDRFRAGVRPISARNTTDLGEGRAARRARTSSSSPWSACGLSRTGSGRLTPEALHRGRSALVGAGQRCSSRVCSAARARWSSRSRATAARMVRSMSKNMAIPFVLVSLGSRPGGGTTKRTADRSSVVVRLKKSNHRTCRSPSARRCEVQDCRDYATSVERGCGAEPGVWRSG